MNLLPEVSVIHASTMCMKTGVRGIFAPPDSHRLLSRRAAKGLSGCLTSCDIALHMHINLCLPQPLTQRKVEKMHQAHLIRFPL